MGYYKLFLHVFNLFMNRTKSTGDRMDYGQRRVVPQSVRINSTSAVEIQFFGSTDPEHASALMSTADLRDSYSCVCCKSSHLEGLLAIEAKPTKAPWSQIYCRGLGYFCSTFQYFCVCVIFLGASFLRSTSSRETGIRAYLVQQLFC